MAERTAIEWRDATFNPSIGYTNVSPGCERCCAEALMEKRYGRVEWGAGAPHSRTASERKRVLRADRHHA